MLDKAVLRKKEFVWVYSSRACKPSRLGSGGDKSVRELVTLHHNQRVSVMGAATPFTFPIHLIQSGIPAHGMALTTFRAGHTTVINVI